jgi:ribonucleoside-diphosphate reductase alpha chain
MMAAVQPFLSGAISKTVNLPNEATPDDILKTYVEGWKLGLKSIAIYRDGSKSNQPMVTSHVSAATPDEALTTIISQRELSAPSSELLTAVDKQFGVYLTALNDKVDSVDSPPRAVRHRLPITRDAVNHKFSISGHEGYLSVGKYKNGQPGEIFITMSKEGSTISGLMDSLALTLSIALQHGVPLETLVSKLSHTRFEPSGWTGNPEIGFAKSVSDYIARWLGAQFIHNEVQNKLEPVPIASQMKAPDDLRGVVEMSDAPPCSFCGCLTVRSGSCYRCTGCGSTSGCS